MDGLYQWSGDMKIISILDDLFEKMGAQKSSATNTPSEVWLAVSRGEIDGQAALMQGKYSVEGDFNLLLKLNEIFKIGCIAI